MKLQSHSLIFLAAPTLGAIFNNVNTLRASYDYIIVGGGTSGLTVASRLSEDASSTILVIEAGSDGSEVQDRILPPAIAYYNGIAGPQSQYDWQYHTVPQSGLNGREVFWPRGKVLGGSSAVNGAYLTRGSSLEYNAWNSLQGSGASQDWSWDATYEYMRRAENFSTPSASNARRGNLRWTESYHGREGPIHFSHSGYIYEQQGAWIPTFESLGIPAREDAYGGQTTGARTSLSCINPSNWTRSYSKTGYLDPNSVRPNLDVLVGGTVTRINWGNRTSAGVSASGITLDAASGASYSVRASREVILSSGVIGTPHLLQISGIGDSDHLDDIGVQTIVDLKGVGMHLNDHLAATMSFETNAEITGALITSNATFRDEQFRAWQQGRADSLYTAPNQPIAYITLNQLFGEQAATALRDSARSRLNQVVSARQEPETVLNGFRALYNIEIDSLMGEDVGAAEILLMSTNGLSITAAIQRPLSRGSVRATSSSIYNMPAIDPGYLSEPMDIQVLREAFKFARRVSRTAPLSDYIVGERSPGSGVSTDAQWEDWIRGAVGTEYHPAGSCSMLPRDLGGVVDTELRVHGTVNVRIIDTSIIAVGMAAHLMEPAYAIGEKGAAIIRGSSNASTTSSSPSNTQSIGSINPSFTAPIRAVDPASSSALYTHVSTSALALLVLISFAIFI